MLNLTAWLELQQPRELRMRMLAEGRAQQLCRPGNLLPGAARLPSPAAEGPAPREVSPCVTAGQGSAAGQGHRSQHCRLAPCHTWSPAVASEDLLTANIAGGGTAPSSCPPRWDTAPRPEVSVHAAAAQKLGKAFECRICVLTNKSIARHRKTVSLKLLFFIS